MNEAKGYAVFFFPQALEALGNAIKPYLQDEPGEPHVLCAEIDTAGALIEMTLEGRARDGKPVALQLMVPTGMVRMIVSAQTDAVFGFTPRIATAPAQTPEALPHEATAAGSQPPDKG